ncbi:MAG TPA: Ku protein [bacterium]|nr:Ku protein [bacterium]
MRPAWLGTIAFGLVSVPVKLYAVVESSQEVAFHLLDRKTLTPIKEVRVNPKTGDEVPWNQVVRGVEYAKGRYVTLTKEELDALPLPSAHTIDLFGFPSRGEVDPLLFDRAYYAGPGEGGQKAYGLLREALEKLDKVGVGKVAMRTREHLAVLRPHGRILVLHTLYFADEVREAADVPDVPRRVTVHANERRMAEQLVSSMAIAFEPDQYRSEYKKALNALVRAKREHKPLPEARPEAKIVDLQEALRRSLEERGAGRGRRRVGHKPMKAAG